MAEFRSWRNANRTPLKDVVPLDTPYNIHVETSAVCNARCIYCGQRVRGAVQDGIMTMQMFRKILADAHCFPQKIKLLDMYYSGEPLCNPKFAEMVTIAKREKIAEQIGVTTNGLLLTRQRVDEIIEAGLDVIRISIQGLDASAYKRICGVNVDFDKFLSILSYLYEHRKKCKVRMKIVDLAIKDIPNGEEIFKEMFGSIADSIFVEKIIPIYSEVNYDGIDQSISRDAQNGRYGIKQEQVNTVCYRPFIKLLVAANGDVSAACCDHISGKDIIYGNIKDANLVDLWNGMKHYSLMRMQLEGKRFQHPLCKDCVVPNDISAQEDLLDSYAGEILNRMKKL